MNSTSSGWGPMAGFWNVVMKSHVSYKQVLTSWVNCQLIKKDPATWSMKETVTLESVCLCYVSSCHHGMAHPWDADGDRASRYGG